MRLAEQMNRRSAPQMFSVDSQLFLDRMVSTEKCGKNWTQRGGAKMSKPEEVEKQELKEKTFKDLIAKKKAALQEIYNQQAKIADLDEKVAKVAGMDPNVVAYW